jgi:DNA-binding MarR family transcriptional regulator
MPRRTSKARVQAAALEPEELSESERSLEARARSVRAIVFMNRLFEYETRFLDISLAQYRLLLYLRHGPKRAGELATHASVTRPALSTLIAGMEQERLIRRVAVPVDRRGVSLEITRKGLATIARVEERFGHVFDDATSDLDRENLLESLTGLCRQLTLEMKTRVRPE